MVKHNRENYKWLFVSLSALAALSLSMQINNNDVKADELSSSTNQSKTTEVQTQEAPEQKTNEDANENSPKLEDSSNESKEQLAVARNNDPIAKSKTNANQAPSLAKTTNRIVKTEAIQNNKLNTPNLSAQDKASEQISIFDPDATQQAKDLFDYLKNYTHSKKILFGQQQATVNGVTLTPREENGGTQSDVRKLTGRNPAVIGWDVGVINGDRKKGLQAIAKSMNAFHKEGGIVVISAHPNNFVTGGDYSDTKGDAVKNILPGGSANTKYNQWLDSIVDLSKELKDQNGHLYAAIYRVFHEQTGAWFWWGNGSTSTDQYIALYRYTVDYFRDHGVHNFLYAYTPGGNLSEDRARYMKTYPGDGYVDVFGVDNYDTGAQQGTQSWFDGVNKDLHTVVNVAEEKGKIPVFAEFGIHLKQDPKQNNCDDWYTKLLNSIESDPVARKIAYMQTWTNFGFPDNVYVPYKGYGDQAIINDFTKYIKDPDIVSAPNNDFASESSLSRAAKWSGSDTDVADKL